MHGSLRAALCAALLYPGYDTQASSVFRCEDSKGHVTFTHHGCPPAHDQRKQQAYNPTPGSAKPIPLAKPRSRSRQTGATEPVVVAERDDGCGNLLTGNELRQAVVRQRIRPGMTRRDVESSLGKPNKISRNNGVERYHYRDLKGNTRHVSFDANGCVKGR